MESIELYGFGDEDRSGKVRWTARELGLEVIERRVAFPAHKEPPYTDLNPFAQIPTARFRGRVLIESTAICHALAEAFDAPKLWVGRGEPEREAYLTWLATFGEGLESRLVECILSKFGRLPAEFLALHGDGVRFRLGVVASRLPAEGWLCGSRFTVADVLAGYSLRLAVQAGLIEHDRVEPYLGRLASRPAAVESRIFARLGV